MLTQKTTLPFSFLPPFSDSQFQLLMNRIASALPTEEPGLQTYKRLILYYHTCQVLGKSKSEIARAPLIFAYNLVIERAEKSGAQV